MPLLRVDMIEGRTADQKRRLVKELTEATCRALGSTPDQVEIILYDIPRGNWADDGTIYADRK